MQGDIVMAADHGVSSETLTVNCRFSGDSFFSVTQRKVQVGSYLVKSKSSIPIGLAPNVFVSIRSAPEARYRRCISR